MPASASARRYATAAFNVASQTGDFDAWLTSLAGFTRVLQMPSARTVFMSPSVPVEQKQHALDKLMPDAPPMIRNFLRILADRDRLDQVPDIADALQDRINQQRGIITAEVTTAIPLDASMERLVAERLAAYLNRDPDKVVIQSHVDPAIIGGVVARVGDRLIDDSVRGRLDRLRRALAGTTR